MKKFYNFFFRRVLRNILIILAITLTIWLLVMLYWPWFHNVN
jgi:hypothetical protein